MPRPYKPNALRGCVSMDNQYVVFTYDPENFKRESSDDGYDTFTIRVKQEDIVKDVVDVPEETISGPGYKLTNRYGAAGEITKIADVDSTVSVSVIGKDEFVGILKDLETESGDSSLSNLISQLTEGADKIPSDILLEGLPAGMCRMMSAEDLARVYPGRTRPSSVYVDAIRSGVKELAVPLDAEPISEGEVPNTSESEHVVPYSRFLQEIKKNEPH